jgi:hypothetical protein
VKRRGFHPDGALRIGQDTVNSVSTGNQLAPAVTMIRSGLYAGRFIVAWEHDPESDGTSQIYAASYTSSGAKDVADFLVSHSTGEDARAPSVAIDNFRQFVVAWQDDDDGNEWYQIAARRYDHILSPPIRVQAYNQFTVNSVSNGQQYTPDVAKAKDGSFVVVWTDNQTGTVFEILGRSFTMNGQVRREDFRVNSKIVGYQDQPAVAFDEQLSPTGKHFIAAWWDKMDEGSLGPDSLIVVRNFTY